MSLNILKSWKRFVYNHLKVKLPVGPNLNKERSFKNVELRKKFEEIEKERRYNYAVVEEYRQELKAKELEYQLNILKTKLKPEEYVGELLKVDLNLPEDLMLRTSREEIFKFRTFEEYRSHKDKMSKIKQLEQDKKKENENELPKTAKELIDMKTIELEKIKMELVKLKTIKNELSTVEQNLSDMEAEYVVLQDAKRTGVLCGVMYYEFLVNQEDGFLLNPETKKNLEYVNYQVENYLPVKRELLYDTFPDMPFFHH